MTFARHINCPNSKPSIQVDIKLLVNNFDAKLVRFYPNKLNTYSVFSKWCSLSTKYVQ